MSAGRVPVSRPAVSQHLKVLKEAELVVEAAAGTRRLYRANPGGLDVSRRCLDRFWSSTLDTFAAPTAAEAEES